MTINPSAWILLAIYVVAAAGPRAGSQPALRDVQNDILKEYIAQKEWIFPTDPA